MRLKLTGPAFKGTARLYTSQLVTQGEPLVALYGRSSQTTYRCGAKLPKEVSIDLATLEQVIHTKK